MEPPLFWDDSIIRGKMSLICIAGKNNIAVEAVEYIYHQSGIKELCVLCNSTDAGVDDDQRSLKKYCLKYSIPICTLENLYDIDDLLFVSLEFEQIVSPSHFKSTRLFNIHFSKLPEYKGMYTSALPILHGQKTSGVTLHKIDSGIDTGNIIASIEFDIDIDDTAHTLYKKYISHGILLFKNNFIYLLNQRYSSRPQPAVGSSYFSKKSIDYRFLNIDLNTTAYQIHNQLRAFIFPQYQLPTISGKMISRSVLTEEKDVPQSIEDCTTSNKLRIVGMDGYVVEAYY